LNGFCWKGLKTFMVWWRAAYIQTREINGLRREGENVKKSASKAATTHANIALGAGLFKLSFFI